MMAFLINNKFRLSVLTIWLFHVSAIIGGAIGHKNWFISLSPLNLMICAFIVLINVSSRVGLAMLIPFFIGMVAEIVGVNTQLLFGNYAYGDQLGLKIFGVPLLIGVNWALLIYATWSITSYLMPKSNLGFIAGALLMVLLDFLMEPLAPRFDYWQFEGGHVPLENYIDWFLVGMIAQFVFHKAARRSLNSMGIHLYLAFFVFFLCYIFIAL